MKKSALIAATLACVIALGGGSVYAAGQIARSSSIGEENARNFAYVDAGILPDDVTFSSAEFDFENGKFVYEIEFTAGGYKYEYTVESTSGRILDREKTKLPDSTQTGTSQSTDSGEQLPGQTVIGADRAKKIALDSAGLTEAEVTFTESKAKIEKGRTVYDIEFQVDGKLEYEYEIDAFTGEILEENWEEMTVPDTTSHDSAQTHDDTGDPLPPSNSNTDAEAPHSDTAQGDTVKEDVTKPQSSDEPDNTNSDAEQNSTITVDEAKTIALGRAGLSAGQVVFSKAKLETENGVLVYEIEFFVEGKAEYEYEINARTGAVLDEDIEPWDAYGSEVPADSGSVEIDDDDDIYDRDDDDDDDYGYERDDNDNDDGDGDDDDDD